MERGERRIARGHQLVVLVRRKIGIERHQTLVQKRINRARGSHRELRVKFYRALQIAQALLEQRWHLFQSRRGRKRAITRRVVFLF